MLIADPSSIALYHNLSTAENPDDPYGPLINCLSIEEELAVLASLRILGLLIALVSLCRVRVCIDPRTDTKPFPYNLTGTLLASLQGLLNGSRQPLWEVAAQVLSAILGTKQFRLAVWEEEHCISGCVSRIAL